MTKEIIGVDNGYGLIKTANTDFTTSLTHYSAEPPLKKRVICYEGEYYVAGGGKRLKAKPDKTVDQDHYILTLVAIAEELKHRGLTEAEVVLSAGLPLMRFGQQKESFKKYLLKNRNIRFQYEGRDYHIILNDVILSPQGYSAVIGDLKNLPNNTVLVDIGSRTVDVLSIIDKTPDLSEGGCFSLNNGVIQCMLDTNEEIRRVFGSDIPEKQIMDVMQGKDSGLPDKYLNIVKEEIRKYAKEIVFQLQESGFNLEVMNFILMGGGASVFKNYGEGLFENVKIITDIHANAKGYETIARKFSK